MTAHTNWQDWPAQAICVDEWMALLDCLAVRCGKLDAVKDASCLGFLETIGERASVVLGVEND